MYLGTDTNIQIHTLGHTHRSGSVHVCTQKHTAMLCSAPGHGGLDSEGCVPALKSHRGIYEAKERRKALQQGITCVRQEA